MEAVTILRELWRRRVLVGALAIVSVLAGLALTYTFSFPPQSRKYEVGIATNRILVDTPDSQVVDVKPRGSDTLGLRANLLANLMVEGKVKAIIAREAGLRPGQLRAGVESEGELPALLASSAGSPDAHLLTARVATNVDGVLPMIELEAQAPEAKDAVKLANAAVVGLRTYLASKAATEDIDEARRLRVNGLGTPQVREAVRGPQRLVAFGVALFVFLAGCAAILIVPAIARSWRAAAARDRAAAGAPPGQGVLELSVDNEATSAAGLPANTERYPAAAEASANDDREAARLGSTAVGSETRRPDAQTTLPLRTETITNGDAAHAEASANDDPQPARLASTAVGSETPRPDAQTTFPPRAETITNGDTPHAEASANDDREPARLGSTAVGAQTRRPDADTTLPPRTETSTNGDAAHAEESANGDHDPAPSGSPAVRSG